MALVTKFWQVALIHFKFEFEPKKSHQYSDFYLVPDAGITMLISVTNLISEYKSNGAK